MKKLQLLLFIIISMNGMAQNERFTDTITTLPIKDGKIFYERIYTDSVSQNQLYTRAKKVFLRLFPATKDVIQNEDKDNGTVSGKGNTFFVVPGRMGLNFEQNIRFTLSISVKDGKYRVQLFDFYYINNMAGPTDAPMENQYFAYYKKNKFFKTGFRNFNLKMLSVLDHVESEMNKEDTF